MTEMERYDRNMSRKCGGKSQRRTCAPRSVGGGNPSGRTDLAADVRIKLALLILTGSFDLNWLYSVKYF